MSPASRKGRPSLVEYGPLVVAAQRKGRSIGELREKTPGDGLVGGLATVDGHPVVVALRSSPPPPPRTGKKRPNVDTW